MFIGDLGIEFKNDSNIEVLKYVDDSKILGFIKNEEDIENLQLKLNDVYDWAKINNMSWNNQKFQLLRIGMNDDLKENTLLFNPVTILKGKMRLKTWELWLMIN